MTNIPEVISDITTIIEANFPSKKIEKTFNAQINDIPDLYNLNDLIILNLKFEPIETEKGYEPFITINLWMFGRNLSKMQYDDDFIMDFITMNEIIDYQLHGSYEDSGRMTPENVYCNFGLGNYYVETIIEEI